MKKIIIINGPNLNLVGQREPDIYGNINFQSFFKKLQDPLKKIKIEHFQSNHEGEIVDKIHSSDKKYDGIIINPGGFTHTSVAIADAIAATKIPVLEVHISDIHNREDYRKNSITSRACVGMISGLGLDSYKLAIEHLTEEIL